MSARGRHARKSNPDVSKYINNGIECFGIVLHNKIFWNPKSKLYYMMKKIFDGKIELPIPRKYFDTKGTFAFNVTDDNRLEYSYRLPSW